MKSNDVIGIIGNAISSLTSVILMLLLSGCALGSFESYE